MSVLFVALPVAILLGASALVAFVWSANRGQFDDLETPRWRILMDDEPVGSNNQTGEENDPTEKQGRS